MLCFLKMYYSAPVFDGEFTGQVVINTTNSEGFVERFTKKHDGYTFQRMVRCFVKTHQLILEQFYFLIHISLLHGGFVNQETDVDMICVQV